MKAIRVPTTRLTIPPADRSLRRPVHTAIGPASAFLVDPAARPDLTHATEADRQRVEAGNGMCPQTDSLATILTALGHLDDAALHTAMTHAQWLLADRPATGSAAQADDLRVEIVDGLEARLLAAVRARPPRARRRLLALVALASFPPRHRLRLPAGPVRRTAAPVAS